MCNVIRQDYLDTLIRLKDKNVIKVVTGIRRCGKSTLLEQFRQYLKANNNNNNQNIININLEDPAFQFANWKALYEYIYNQLEENKHNYIFLDEVQVVQEFQRAVDGLFIKPNCDVYITGSNASILSGELATLLSGRYIEIRMMCFSFKEFCSAYPETMPITLYNKYLKNSSFPFTLQLQNDNDIMLYLQSLFDSIILKDIVTRYKIADVTQLNHVIEYIFDNIGNLSSSSKIANTMINSGKKISVHTVDNYLDVLGKCFVIYKAQRYDLKGKQYLVGGAKYYLCDIGLRYAILGHKTEDLGHILENVVYLELLRRGKEVYVGKYGDKEVDFIAVGGSVKEYYQVAYSTASDENIFKREISVLQEIKDNYPKFLLTMDFTPTTDYNGITQMNVIDWLINR